ncbi:MAG: deoxyribodipyrimidine photo-lyase, partial [Calditrichae bacterium]|nr:deoxyribodipyrimidine photo-lyase [Calditrichia bacterium]
LLKENSIAEVYTNYDYEPYAIKRDKEVQKLLRSKNVAFHTFKDQVIFEKSEILTHQETPYTIYTPYQKRWKENLSGEQLKSFPSEKRKDSFVKLSPQPMPGLEEIGFESVDGEFPSKTVREEIIENYHRQRDYPGIDGTSRLGVHLRFGTVSVRRLVRRGLELNETWLDELIWREFYMMILWHFPHVVDQPFKSKYAKIPWRNNEQEFERWCQGKTGYAMVDAGMRELNQTGYMHNRVRMVTASFLTKHLLIDWRWGERYFARKLLDYELASNNGNWQWAAGCGCDAAPYFRIFNPTTQIKKFDPEHQYIKKWIPELKRNDYPAPIV